MYRRLSMWLAVGMTALLLVPAALAVRRARPCRRQDADDLRLHRADPERAEANALDALESASLAGEFYYHVTQSATGPTSTRSTLAGGGATGGSSGSTRWAAVGTTTVTIKDINIRAIVIGIRSKAVMQPR